MVEGCGVPRSINFSNSQFIRFINDNALALADKAVVALF